MVELYVSWVKGLPEDKEALKLLKSSGIVDGVELSNVDAQVERIRESGLKVSSHTPGVYNQGFNTLNLANPNYMKAFDGEQGKRLLQVIRESEAPVVGFHCGYSAENVYKMKAASNVPKISCFLQRLESITKANVLPGDENNSESGVIFTDPNELSSRITKHIVLLERLVNSGIPEEKRKQLLLETLEYMRERPINWDIQSDEVKANRKEMEETLRKYGINCGQEFITDPSFVRKVLDEAGKENIKPIGFLFDIGHNFIAADAKINDRRFQGTIEDYFAEMLWASNGRTYQMHLTVPQGNEQEGYLDIHNTFSPGDKLSDRIVELAKGVVVKSPELMVVTLEMGTNLKPIEHAKEMLKQAEYARKVLNLM